MEILFDVCNDTLRLLPFLFITYLLLSYIEHSDLYDFHQLILRYKILGPFLGALFGLLPQCGFSVMAACLYLNSSISIGTLVAVFLSTSDEAFPMLLAHPGSFMILLRLVIAKVLLALVVGYLVDVLTHFHFHSNGENTIDHEEYCEGIWKEAFQRTVSVLFYIFIFSLILSILIDQINQQELSLFLKDLGIFQPLVCSLIGFIPNCASSILLCELYLYGLISSGSLFAGLCCNAGLGFTILLRARAWKTLIFVGGALFVSAWLAFILF